jgi:hypothetical protein
MSIKDVKINIRSLIIGLVVIGISLYFIKICLGGLNNEYVETQWKTTQGTILNPNIKLDGKKNIERTTQGYEQTINYQYEVDGIKHQSNSVSREIFVLVKDFPEGKIVNVYYNPKDVTDSILIRKEIQKQYLYGLIGFCIFVIFIMVYLIVKDLFNQKH